MGPSPWIRECCPKTQLVGLRVSDRRYLRMRYGESKRQSSELLRLIIPLMSKHAAGCTPVAYAVWYEYTAGMNPALEQALDGMIDSGGTLTAEQAQILHTKYILGRDEEAQEKLQSDFKRLVGDVSDAASSADEKAGEFVDALERRGAELKQVQDAQAAAHVMHSLLGDTQEMRESVSVLKSELIASIQEVENLRKELERTQGQALIDPLTGLKNRRGVDKVIDDLHGPEGKGLAGCCLLMLDIDDFKRVNDTYGHLLGDKVIRTVAQLLVAAVKGKDMVARWGGEEFLILLPDTPLEGAKALAENIRSAVERGRIRRMDCSDHIGAVTISTGVALYQPRESFEDLIQRADTALYAAKQSGRNRVMIAADKVAEDFAA
jgi:diguanylate cyclase